MTSTAPGSELTVIVYKEITEHGYFDEKAPLGGVLLGTTERLHRGVLAYDNGTILRIMRIDRHGDFSGWTTGIRPSQVVDRLPARIGANHELIIGE